MKILIGSNNLSKQKEMLNIFSEIPATLITPQNLNVIYDPPEVSGTHKEIAEQKALQWSTITDHLVISTDGGLIIPTLGKNWNSTLTKRQAGENASDLDRARYLLETLKFAKGIERTASWIECVAIAQSNKLLKSWEISGPEGMILSDIPSEDISPFWVNHIWYFPEKDKTYHHMDELEKCSLSDHWITITNVVQNFFRDSYPEL